MNDIDSFVAAINNPALRNAYACLSSCTPLRGDCGRLCQRACCHGDKGEGMLLFPLEEELFVNAEGFDIIEREGFGRLLVCNGKCLRRQRPLACRIFPLFPLIYEENGETNLKIIRDPRFSACPLSSGEIRLDPRFVRSVRLAGKYLMRDEIQRRFLTDISEELIEILSLRERLGII